MKKVIGVFVLIGFLASCNTTEKNKTSDSMYSKTIQKIETPDAIVTFYDKVLNDPGNGGQNLELIKKGLSDDWNTRPNPLNPIDGIGPNPEGVKQILGLWALIIPDLYVERQKTIVNGNTITVLSKIGGTINKNLPPEMKEIPFFPGILADKVKGKKFETMALDIQVLNEEGKIFRTWHMEDWKSAQEQLVNGSPVQDFGFSEEYLDLSNSNEYLKKY